MASNSWTFLIVLGHLVESTAFVWGKRPRYLLPIFFIEKFSQTWMQQINAASYCISFSSYFTFSLQYNSASNCSEVNKDFLKARKYSKRKCSTIFFIKATRFSVAIMITVIYYKCERLAGKIFIPIIECLRLLEFFRRCFSLILLLIYGSSTCR